jgi:hypothetical protein
MAFGRIQGGKQDNRNMACIEVAFQFPGNFKSRQARHQDITDYQIGIIRISPLQPCISIGFCHYFKVNGEFLFQELTHIRIIFYNQ